MKLLSLTIGVISLIVVANAGWLKSYEISEFSVGQSVRQTLDGGYIIGGISIESESIPPCFLLIKTDENGDTQWTRQYEGNGDKNCYCIQQTKDGGYVMVGYKNGSGYWPGGDLWLVKTDSVGYKLWDKVYGGVFYSSGNWVEQTSDGGYILTGTLDQTYLWLIKTDENGDTTWCKRYEWGDYHETGYCVKQTSDDGYVIASNMGLFKTNSDGDSLWIKPWVSECVEQTSDNGYILATGHNNDIWLIKTDSIGDTVWTKTYGGDSTDISCDVHQTKDGGYVVIGASGSFGGIWLLKTDANGDTTWTRIYKVGGVSSGEQTSDGGYIITGETKVSFPEDIWPDVLLLKTDSLGYVGIAEPIITPAQTDWQVLSPIGSTVTLRYSNLPQGFHAFVYDASGRKVDEIQSQGESGTFTWGQGRSPGVYFIKTNSPNTLATKVVLLK